MSSVIDRYLDAIRKYTSHVTVPGLSVISDPMPLQDVFVQLQVAAYSAVARSRANIGSTDRTRQSRGTPQTGAKLTSRPVPQPEEASAVLKRCPRLVILGEPGQGKSTLLRHYASTLASETDGSWIPLFVELGKKREPMADAGDKYAWLYGRLPQKLATAIARNEWRVFVELIKSGRTRILLDGFDELTRDARVQIVALLEDLPANQIVLTSRPHAYATAALRDFTVYRLEDLGRDQVQKLASAVCGALASKFGCDNYADALEKVLSVEAGPAGTLARNPLFLSFLCLSAVKKSGEGTLDRFPTRPTPLIAECMDALVEWHLNHKPGKTWPRDLLAPTVTRILAPLALATFQDRTGRITAQALEQLKKEDKYSFLTHLVDAEFVSQRDQDYVFPLETFREYFAALAISSSSDPFAQVRSHLHSPEWERVILYASGVPVNTRASWLVMAAPSLTGLVKWTAPIMKLLGAVAGKAVPAQPVEAGGEALKAVLEAMGGPLQVRAEAWLTRSRRTTEFFVAAILRHRCRYHRLLSRDLRLAVRCLGVAAECPERLVKGAVASLLHAAARQPSGQISHKVICEALRQGAANAQVRNVLAKFARSGRQKTRDVAQGILQGDTPIPSTRVTVQPAPSNSPMSLSMAIRPRIITPAFPLDLTRAETPPAPSPLVDQPATLRDPARDLTFGLNAPAPPATVSEPPRFAPPSSHALPTSFAVDSQGKVRALQGDQVVPFFPSELPQPHYVEGTIERHPGYSVFVDVQGARHRDPRQERNEAILRTANPLLPEGRTELLRLAEDVLPGVRFDALQKLRGVIGRPEVFECFLKHTRDPWPKVRVAVVTALGSVGPDARIHARLIEMLSDHQPQVCAAVVMAFKSLGLEDECRDSMLALTGAADPEVRAQAAGALLRVASDPVVQKCLLDLLNDPDSEVRSAALQSLRGWEGLVPRGLVRRLAWRVRRLRLGSMFGDALLRISFQLWLELPTGVDSLSEASEAWLTLDVLLQAREQQRMRRET